MHSPHRDLSHLFKRNMIAGLVVVFITCILATFRFSRLLLITPVLSSPAIPDTFKDYPSFCCAPPPHPHPHPTPPIGPLQRRRCACLVPAVTRTALPR